MLYDPIIIFLQSIMSLIMNQCWGTVVLVSKGQYFVISEQNLTTIILLLFFWKKN